MRKGFTLLELLIVVIIIGVLATLGVMQYQGAIEKSRGAEARQIMGMLRTMCASYYMSEGAGTSCTDANLRIGTGADWVPSACRTTHYFNYAASGNTNGVVVTATRCTAGGKTPQGDGTTLTLSSNFTSGDTWGGTGSY